MDLEFGDGLLQSWYDWWLCLVGFVAALLLTVTVVSRGNWQTSGLLLKTALVAAALAATPLALARIGLNIAGNPDALGYLSLVGLIGALAAGLPYLFISLRESQSVAQPYAGEVVTPGAPQAVTPEEGTPLAPDVGDATRTLTSEEAVDSAGTRSGDDGAAAPAPTQAPPAWLHFKSGPRAGESIPLSPGVTSIGRGADNDVVVDDAAVSRQHATIAFHDGQYVVEDAGNSSGTIVEGAPAAETVLTSGSSINLGETEIVFMQSEGTVVGGVPGATAASGAAPAAGGQPGETVVMGAPSESVMAWLAVTGGPDKGKTLQLLAKDCTVGRDEGNDLALADAGVSRRHALLKY